MSRRLKFKPVVNRIKLNAEQAVLSCACYTPSLRQQRTDPWGGGPITYDACVIDPSGWKNTRNVCGVAGNQASS